MKRMFLFVFLTMLDVVIFSQELVVIDGATAIRDIHDNWLIIRLPGFEKKLNALDSLLQRQDLMVSARVKLEEAKEQTLTDRDFIHKWYPVAFDSAYSFSRFAFIYTHETEEFQNGKKPARSSDGQDVFYAMDGLYFFATLDGYVGDPFRFANSSHQKAGYPFPNNLAMSGILIPGMSGHLPDWIASIDEEQGLVYRVYRHAARVDRKLSKFYKKVYALGEISDKG